MESKIYIFSDKEKCIEFMLRIFKLTMLYDVSFMKEVTGGYEITLTSKGTYFDLADDICNDILENNN